MANKIKINQGDTLFFGGTPPSGTIGVPMQIDYMNQSTYKTNISYLDLGPGPRPTKFEWRVHAVPAPTSQKPIYGKGISVYIINKDEPLNESEINSNGALAGKALLENPGDSVGYPITAEGTVQIYNRYLGVAWYNYLNRPLASGNYFSLTYSPKEAQNG